MPISNSQLHTQLTSWARNQGVDGGIGQMTSAQVQQAATELNVPLNEVLALQVEVLQQGTSANEAAGARSASLRDAVGDASAGRQAANPATSPALMGHQFADVGATSQAAGIAGIDPDLRHEEVMSALWGNTFWGEHPGAFGPLSRFDFETDGRVEGWTLDMSGDTPTHERFSGQYEMDSATGKLSVTLDNGDKLTGQMNVRDGEWALAMEGARVPLRTDGAWDATPDDEPSVLLLDNPWWGPAPGVYGAMSKAIFDVGGDVRGWTLDINPDTGAASREPFSGKWDFDHDSSLVTLSLDREVNGKKEWTGKLTDDGPVFPSDSPFSKMWPDGDFFSA